MSVCARMCMCVSVCMCVCVCVCVFKGLENTLAEVEIREKIEAILTTALLKSCGILRRVLED